MTLQEDTNKNKPISRPKRSCRFGPRTRRRHREKLSNDTPNSSPPLKHNEETTRRQEKGSPSPLKPQYSPTNFPPQDLQHIPDKVTLQPVVHTRRTPFDQYKINYGNRKTKVNTSKHAAFPLGIPETVFKEELTKEINDLLREIETTRLGELESSELGCSEGQADKVPEAHSHPYNSTRRRN